MSTRFSIETKNGNTGIWDSFKNRYISIGGYQFVQEGTAKAILEEALTYLQRYVNLTSWPIRVVMSVSKVTVELPIQGKCTLQTKLSDIDGGLAKRTVFSVNGLPEPMDDTLYIVPGLVFHHKRDRDDLVVPISFGEGVTHHPNGSVNTIPGFYN